MRLKLNGTSILRQIAGSHPVELDVQSSNAIGMGHEAETMVER
ncbi:hypothetical protein [Rhizobium rhizogenes]|nr:hypothetical protein [Rhizobium rhizogenes]